MSSALITGSSGFVGTHLLSAVALEGPAPVELLDPASVRSCVEVAQPQVVFHLAGALRAPDPRAVYETNVLGTVNRLEAVQALAPRAVVVVMSSSAVYGEQTVDPLAETAELRPLTHHAASKAAQEQVARRAALGGTLDVRISRVFNIVGQPARLAAGSFAALEGEGGDALKVGNLAAMRDLVDVRDIVRLNPGGMELDPEWGRAPAERTRPPPRAWAPRDPSRRCSWSPAARHERRQPRPGRCAGAGGRRRALARPHELCPAGELRGFHADLLDGHRRGQAKRSST